MHPAKSFSLQPKQVRFGIIHTSLVLMEFKMFPFFTGKRFKKNTKYSEKNNLDTRWCYVWTKLMFS